MTETNMDKKENGTSKLGKALNNSAVAAGAFNMGMSAGNALFDAASAATGFEKDSVDAVADTAADVAGLFGPWGKCVCKGTKVVTNTGKIKNIEDVHVGDILLGFDGEKITEEPVIHVFEPYLDDCIEINLTNGYSLKCNKEHPIYARKSGRASRETINNKRVRIKKYNFINANNLLINDSVAVVNNIDLFGTKKLDNAYLIGMLIGDGTYGGKGSAKLFTGDLDTWNYLEKNNLGTLIPTSHYEDYNKEFRTYRILNIVHQLQEIGIRGQTKLNKRLPININDYDKESICKLIAGLFDTDGCVCISNSIKESSISFDLKNFNLIKLVLELLIKLGIHSSISKNKSNNKFIKNRLVKSGPIYKLKIKDKQSIINFYNNIPLNISYKKNNLKLLFDFKNKIFTKDHSELSYVRAIRIKSINNIGKLLVYNIETGNSHTYLANFIVTHNCAALAIKGLNFLSKATGEKYSELNLNTGSSGFADFSTEGKLFRGNPLNPLAAFTKSGASAAYELQMERQRKKFALAKSVVQELEKEIKARLQAMDNTNQRVKSTLNGGQNYDAILSKEGSKLLPINNYSSILDYADDFINSQQHQVAAYKDGGSVIPEGELHKNKHNLEAIRPELEGLITHKGIPVITEEVDPETGNTKITQHAEIECGEVILELSITKKLEKLYKEGTDEAAIEAGKILAKELITNTEDNTGELLDGYLN